MDSLFAVKYAYLIPLLPLIGAMIAGFFGAKFLKGASHWPIWIGVGASALISLSLLWGMLGIWHANERAKAPESRISLATSTEWYTWIRAGTVHPQAKEPGEFVVNAGAWIDSLTAVMLCVVTGVGFLITVFSAGYMKGEEGYYRFFAYLGLFIFMMTILVMGKNFIMLYLGWEGVGLSSYLLIGYYYEKPAAREAAKKAFLVNRVGDFGFSLGIMLIFYIFGTVSFFDDHTLASSINGVFHLSQDAAFLHGLSAAKLGLIKYIPFLLMIGAFGKSAQFPLYVWLPDAMEGPTPVSALIHAATMVTAGIYMIARCGVLFVPNHAAMATIAVVGAITALFAAVIALRQFDLKKVFAYSTISQLGYMVVAVGVLTPVAGVFHLVTHAFFKALLFLCCGVVMHAMSGHLDMRKMSGLKRVLPKTRWLMLIGCAALAGFPFVSGFFSKDEIVGAAFAHSSLLGAVMLFTAFLTAYYTFRLYFRVFEGPEIIPQTPASGHGHDDHAADPAGASHSAIATGTSAESDVDTAQTDHAPAGHDSTGHDSGGHGAGGHGSGHHNHEPMLMILPLIVLAIGALMAGYLNWPARTNDLGAFLGQSPSFRNSYLVANGAQYQDTVSPDAFGQEAVDNEGKPVERAPFNWVMGISALTSIFGIFLAYLMHLKYREALQRLAERYPGITRLIEGKFWVDEIYQAAIVEPLRTLGRVLYAIDRIVVDGVVWIIGFVAPESSGTALRLTMQRGYLQGYAVTMLFGLVVILVVMFL